MTLSATSDGPLWVFGYGSVIWRPAFPFIEAHSAVLHGYVRRYWQGSPDHRGTPTRPGRVVTLVPRADGACHGRVFQVEPAQRDAVLKTLDERESGGYERRWLEVETEAGTLEALSYIASVDNANFLGEAPLDDVVEQVLAARGQSGDNVHYVLELERALASQAIVDPHVRELAEALTERLESPGR